MVHVNDIKALVDVCAPTEWTSDNFFSHNKDSRFLIACSGGADSVALALIAFACDANFTLAYVEHGIQEETRVCTQIVRDLAFQCNVEYVEDEIDLDGDAGNVESRARLMRYSALEKMRKHTQCDFIATAHHLDDNVETYLINLIRGSGSGGASLATQRNNIVRPLKEWRKESLRALVEKAGCPFFEDPSNSDPRYVRNRIRHEVIPLLDDIAGRDSAPLIARASDHIAADNAYLDGIAQQYVSQDILRTRELSQLDPVILHHALRIWITGTPPSAEELDRIVDVVFHRIKSTQISGFRTIWRSGSLLHQDVTSPLHTELSKE